MTRRTGCFRKNSRDASFSHITIRRPATGIEVFWGAFVTSGYLRQPKGAERCPLWPGPGAIRVSRTEPVHITGRQSASALRASVCRSLADSRGGAFGGCVWQVRDGHTRRTSAHMTRRNWCTTFSSPHPSTSASAQVISSRQPASTPANAPSRALQYATRECIRR